MADPVAYDYTTAGFDKFFNRSVDNSPQSNLDSPPAYAPQTSRHDDLQTSGVLGDSFRIGNITLDGSANAITLSDGENTRLLIGEDKDGF